MDSEKTFLSGLTNEIRDSTVRVSHDNAALEMSQTPIPQHIQESIERALSGTHESRTASNGFATSTQDDKNT